MSERKEPGDYEVGYGKPPKDGKFQKGVSGNPSGRPKKPSDFVSELMRELNSKVIINENGQRKAIKKFLVMMRQLANKAASGDLKATRMVLDYGLQAQERAAEQQQSSPNKPDQETNAKNVSDEELQSIIRAHLERSVPGDTEPDN
jgi:hypothetical protein